MIGVVNENRALVEPYADVVDEVIENLQFHANSGVDPLIVEDGPLEEEFKENEIEEDNIALEGGQLVNANVVNSTQSLSNN